MVCCVCRTITISYTVMDEWSDIHGWKVRQSWVHGQNTMGGWLDCHGWMVRLSWVDGQTVMAG